MVDSTGRERAEVDHDVRVWTGSHRGTWAPMDVPYLLLGDLQVLSAHLTLLDGVEVLVSSGVAVWVQSFGARPNALGTVQWACRPAPRASGDAGGWYRASSGRPASP